MTRDQIADRCAKRFLDTGNRIVTAAEWAEYINDVYTEVAGTHPDWPFLESRNEALSVTAGTGTVTLPTDVWRVTAVYNATDDYALDQMHGRAEHFRRFPDPASNLGQPSVYRLRSNVLEVYPWPATTTTLHVDVVAPPAELGASSEPVFPEQYHRMLIDGALAMAYGDQGELERGQAYRGRFERQLQNMLVDLLGPRGESYPVVLDVW